MKSPRKYLSKNKGFTLIETLVSLALFSVVLVISGGVIVSVIDINRRNQAISSVVNNLNYSIDSMVRDIKTGYLYKCDYSGAYTIEAFKNDENEENMECPNSRQIILVSTISGEDVIVKYELVSVEGSNGYIKKTIFTDTASAPYSITDKVNVDIEDLNFTVKNPDALDSENPNAVFGQPSVFLMIKGVAGNEEIESSKFFIQTFISQRLINLTDFNN